MPTPPPSVLVAVASIPIGAVLIAYWLYASLHWDTFNSTRPAAAISFAAILLAAGTVAAPAAAGAASAEPTASIEHIEDAPRAAQQQGTPATPTPTPTATPGETPGETATTTPTPTPRGSNSTIQQLLSQQNWTASDISKIAAWIQTHDVSQLSSATREKLHNRLLEYDAAAGSGRQVPQQVYAALGASTATPTTTPTPTPTPNAATTPAAGSSGNVTNYAAAIDSHTRIVSWSYDDHQFTIVIESDRPQLLTIIKPISTTRGISRFQMGSRMIPEGRTTLKIEVRNEVRGMAVITLATQRAGVSISTGTEALTVLGEVGPYFSWFWGAVIGLSLTIAAGYYRKRQENKKPRRVTR
ncbi:MAG: hypothetical protein ABEJ94_06795 [Halorientalis sp.]